MTFTFALSLIISKDIVSFEFICISAYIKSLGNIESVDLTKYEGIKFVGGTLNNVFCADALDIKYEEGKKSEILLPGEAEQLVETYGELNESIRHLKIQKEEVTNQLKAMLGENEKGRTENHIVSWTTIVKRTTDVDKVKEHLGEAYEDCLKESRYRKFSVA